MMRVKVIDRKTNTIDYQMHFVLRVWESEFWYEIETKTRLVKLGKATYKIRVESD